MNVEKFGINVVIYGTKMWSFFWNILPLQSDFFRHIKICSNFVTFIPNFSTFISVFRVNGIKNFIINTCDNDSQCSHSTTNDGDDTQFAQGCQVFRKGQQDQDCHHDDYARL